MIDSGNTPARWMTLRYSIALLLIALCTVAGFAMTERVIGQHERMLEVVNISGRQRMLSQRSAFLVEQLEQEPAGPERAKLIAQLSEAADMLEQAHARLSGSGPEPAPAPVPHEEYFEGPEPLDQMVRNYVAALRRILAVAPAGLTPGMPEIAYVTTQARQPLLDRLEAVVAAYQEEGEAGFHTLHQLGLGILLLTLAFLAMEAAVIFRPMTRQVRRQFADLTRMADTIRQANATLEDQVRERTAELKAAKEAAEQAHRAKSRFLTHASHDLQQPLQAIGMFTGMLERQEQTPKAHALIADLREAQRSMRTLLTAILDISKLESGVVAPSLGPVPLAPLLARLEAEILPLAESKDLQLRILPTDAVVLSDPALLERILRNLLVNAVRYTTEGGVLLGCRRRGGDWRVEIHDTGRGIAEADRRRIFEEFVQLDDPARDRSEGIGLGLAIVDRLARLLGHRLSVRSQQGRGSVFAVTLPRASDQPAVP